ncbi:Valine--pyruvate aminotransferase, partial [Rhizina undulata]
MQSSKSRSPEAAQPSIPTPIINLERTCQSKNLLPAASIAYASRSVLTDPYAYADALHYGPAMGSTPLRHEIAAWLTKFYSPKPGSISAERICITGGASQNLAAMLQKFTDPVYTRSVIIVAPMPLGFCKVFEDNGLEGKIRAVLEDSEGVDIAGLTQLLKEEEAKATAAVNFRPVFKSPKKYPKIYKHIIFCAPTFKNPTTKTMSIQRREELVE